MQKLNIEAKVENLSEVIGFLDSRLEELDCPMKVQIQLDVAVEELFVNIAHYAYGSETGMAEILFDHDPQDNAVSITFIDSGVPYDPLAKPDPDVTLSAEEREIGGLGIYMVKKSVTDISYKYEDGHNILTIVKRLT